MSLAITILTGRRPALLRQTVESLVRHAEPLCREAHVVVFVNGADSGTMRIVNALPWVDELLVGDERPRPIGEAISFLMGKVPSAVDYVMHLEDDWTCTGAGWFGKATWILGRHPTVGQVRLRHYAPPSMIGQRVLAYHMLTRAPIRWQDKRASSGFHYRIGGAHFTFNPSVIRRSLLSAVYPCQSERDAMLKFHRKKLQAAQLLPGAFWHAGTGDKSLRARTSSA